MLECKDSCRCPKKECNLSDYAYIYNRVEQDNVTVGSAISFSDNLITKGITHTPGSAAIVLSSAGVYDIQYYAYFQNRNQIEIRVNGVPLPNIAGRYGTNSGNDVNFGHVIASLPASSTLTLVLVFAPGGSSSLTTFPGGGGAPVAVNASIIIKKIDK